VEQEQLTMPVILDQTQLEVLMEQMAAGRLFVVHVKLPSVKEGAVATAIVVSDAHVDSIMPRARRAGAASWSSSAAASYAWSR